MSELTQLEKTKDPHPEFMTEWTSFIEKYLKQDNFQEVINIALTQTLGHLDYTKHRSCLVGEIHGFTSDYIREYSGKYCDYCYQHSHYLSFRITALDDFYSWKDEMYNHMQEKHWK